MNYLIFRNDGIGDLIVSTPLINEIKKNDPNSKVYLITSDRNDEFAELLLNHIVDHKFRLRSKPTLFELIGLFFKLIKISFNYTIVLKPKNYNYWLAFLLFPKTKLGVQIVSDYKEGIKHRPSAFLSKILLNYYEIIDYSENYTKDSNIHHYQHYLNIFNKFISNHQIDSNKIYRYFRPVFENEFSHINEYFKNNRITLIHLDEKWERISWNTKNYIDLIVKIKEKTNNTVIVTEGIRSTYINDEVKNYLMLESTSVAELNKSSSVNNIYYIQTPSIKLITYLVYLSNLVVEPHGSLAHIASMFNKKTIDLIYPEYINYLKKWKPRTDKYSQISISDFEKTINEINEVIDIFNC